jgi:hypothetical protein
MPSRDVLPHVIDPLVKGGLLPGIAGADHDEIWALIEKIRADTGGEASSDLKGPEFNVFTNPDPPQDWPDFMVTREDAPATFQDVIDYVVLCERLREVNALIGFTRVEPPEETSGAEDAPARAPLATGTIEWVPATEVRGEGIFLRFNAKKLASWLSRQRVQERTQQLLAAHRAFRSARRLDPPDARFPGALYVLLHSFAHILIRELALECGYSAASVRERIYASRHGESPDMAGILIYTAAPDSDGTLGGLVELGRAHNLGPLIERALRRAAICASDPLCAEHNPNAHDRSLHGAACHACSFVAETSCEIGNRYLDRAFIVPTSNQEELSFFGGVK